MKCHKCKSEMKYTDNLKFNDYEINGWICSCGERYYEPEDAQRILLLNKLKKQTLKVKLGKVRSNLILRLPREIEKALNLENGESVDLKIEGNTIKIIPT